MGLSGRGVVPWAAAAIAVACGTSPPAESGVLIEYVAHATFRVTSTAGFQVVIDPYGSRIWIGYDFPSALQTHAVFISHPHYDHDGGVSRGQAFPWPDSIPVYRDPGRYEVGDIVVQGVRGKHADPYGQEFGQINTIWRIEVDGVRIVHVGDNGPLTDGVAQELGSVDVLMLPIDAQYHILQEEAILHFIDALDPAWLVPMHYRIPSLEPEAGKPDDLGDLEPWLAGRSNVRRLGTHDVELTPAALPAITEIVVFDPSPRVGRP